MTDIIYPPDMRDKILAASKAGKNVWSRRYPPPLNGAKCPNCNDNGFIELDN